MSSELEIPNILADRYTSEQLKKIWHPVERVLKERNFWIALMKIQARSKVKGIPKSVIDAYESVKTNIDLASIKKRETVLKHDVKARIEAFNQLAGHQAIHEGLTSRDLTEIIEQLQLFDSLIYLRLKGTACLKQLVEKVNNYASLRLTGRTHNVAAQTTTLGRRFAMFAEELLHGLNGISNYLENYQLRGLKGPIGTQSDLLNLLGKELLENNQLETEMIAQLYPELKKETLPKFLNSTGQIYARSFDFEAGSVLYQLCAPLSSFAKTIRLMAGEGLLHEGFAKGQVGSSAMPHKINSRSCERINGLYTVLRGYLGMLENLSGEQWNEGDVSCSVVRRIALPNICFATDSLMNTFLDVMEGLTIHEKAIELEHKQYEPFLLTTGILMECLKAGMGREIAHHAIQQHALKALEAIQKGKENDLLKRIEEDPNIPLKAKTLETLKTQANSIGRAKEQIQAVSDATQVWIKNFPELKTLEKSKLL